MIVTASGQVVAGKRRIEKFLSKHRDAKVVVSELHHYAMVAGGYLRAARDERGRLHLATQSAIDAEGWEEVVGNG